MSKIPPFPPTLGGPLRFVPWPLAPEPAGPRNLTRTGEPKNADGTPNFAYLDMGEWWEGLNLGYLGRGFVSNERFQRGTEAVIPRTNRAVSRKWRKTEAGNAR